MKPYYDHGQLVKRSIRWLDGTKRCPLVLSGVASTAEIPDAIGWSTRWEQRGSILVECKTSIADLVADGRKKHPLRIGRFRYFFVSDDLIDAAFIEKRFPDHGLAVVRKDRVYEIRPAPPRPNQDYDSEIRLLVFAHVNCKGNLSRFSIRAEQWSDLMQAPASPDAERNSQLSLNSGNQDTPTR